MAIRFHRTALVADVPSQEAAAFATEVSKYSTETLGIPTAWGMQVGGTFGTVHWFTDFANMTELEAGLGTYMSDAGYNEILSRAKDLFVEGSIEDSMIYMM